MSKPYRTGAPLQRMTAVLAVALTLSACGDDKPAVADEKPRAAVAKPQQAADDSAGTAQSAPAREASRAGAGTQATPSGGPLATLGSISVERAEIETLLANLPAQQGMQLRGDRASLERVIRARLSEKALVIQARNQGWQERDEVKRAIALATEQVVLRSYLDSVSMPPEAYPSEPELQAAYEANKAQFVQQASYRISQIFLPVAEGDAAALTQARKQAADLIKRARAPQADFAALARSNSQDAATSKNGGDMGFVALGQIVPELRGVVQGLQPGEISEPIQLRGGVHILKLIERQAQTVASLESVKPQLRAALRAQRQEQAARAYLEGLVDAGTVSIDGKAVNALLQAAP